MIKVSGSPIYSSLPTRRKLTRPCLHFNTEIQPTNLGTANDKLQQKLIKWKRKTKTDSRDDNFF